MPHHHLILVREADQQMSGSGCCGRIEGDAVLWDRSGRIFAERREKMLRVGEIYRAVRAAFGQEIEITIVDPRNVVSFVPLVCRDAVRHKVPFSTALRAMTATSLSSAVFDGQVLYSYVIPPPEHVVRMINERLEIDRVGMIPTAETPVEPRSRTR